MYQKIIHHHIGGHAIGDDAGVMKVKHHGSGSAGGDVVKIGGIRRSDLAQRQLSIGSDPSAVPGVEDTLLITDQVVLSPSLYQRIPYCGGGQAASTIQNLLKVCFCTVAVGK